MRKHMNSYALAISIFAMFSPLEGTVSKNSLEGIYPQPAPNSLTETPEGDSSKYMNLPKVPSFIGLDMSNKKLIQEKIRGTGFSLVVVGSQKSNTVLRGI